VFSIDLHICNSSEFFGLPRILPQLTTKFIIQPPPVNFKALKDGWLFLKHVQYYYATIKNTRSSYKLLNIHLLNEQRLISIIRNRTQGTNRANLIFGFLFISCLTSMPDHFCTQRLQIHRIQLTWSPTLAWLPSCYEGRFFSPMLQYDASRHRCCDRPSPLLPASSPTLAALRKTSSVEPQPVYSLVYPIHSIALVIQSGAKKW